MDEGKLSLESKDIAAEKRQELLRIFPEAQTEGGKIDFNQLKRALGESVDAVRERYGMNWPGKADCFRLIQSPSTATLLPVREESVRFDETENMIIEGDNLEVLKLLQKGYQSKVKMIYIDPPYNTGNDFIYPDDFSDNLNNYLQYTGQADAEGKRFTTNLETDGRFHSNWLNMMYPRLYLARNLLHAAGSIFISINENELSNLCKLCDEVFGASNAIATMIWQKSKKGDSKLIATTHEYVVVYCRNKQALIDEGLWRKKKLGADEVLAQFEIYRSTYNGNYEFQSAAMRKWYSSLSASDERRQHEHYRWADSRGLYFASDFAGPDDGRRSRPRYDILHPLTGKSCKKPSTGWRWEEERTKKALLSEPPAIHFGPDETTVPCRKTYLADISTEPLASVFYKDGRTGTLELEGLLGKGLIEFPKDAEVLSDLIEVACASDGLILDFFAGSGTTAQATLDRNLIDNKRRNFILCQLPERCNNENYANIAAIARARVREVIDRQECSKKDIPETSRLMKKQPVVRTEGFRAFKLASSNFKIWDTHTDEGVKGIERQMELAVNHIMPDRTAEDLFYEILMKSEYPLTAKVETFDAAGIPAYSVEGDALIVCVERKVTAEAIAVIAKRSPSKVILLDEAFSGNDQLKANARMNFESAGVKRFETV